MPFNTRDVHDDLHFSLLAAPRNLFTKFRAVMYAAIVSCEIFLFFLSQMAKFIFKQSVAGQIFLNFCCFPKSLNHFRAVLYLDHVFFARAAETYLK